MAASRRRLPAPPGSLAACRLLGCDGAVKPEVTAHGEQTGPSRHQGGGTWVQIEDGPRHQARPTSEAGGARRWAAPPFWRDASPERVPSETRAPPWEGVGWDLGRLDGVWGRGAQLECVYALVEAGLCGNRLSRCRLWPTWLQLSSQGWLPPLLPHTASCHRWLPAQRRNASPQLRPGP
jgi:hypothetical protein